MFEYLVEAFEVAAVQPFCAGVMASAARPGQEHRDPSRGKVTSVRASVTHRSPHLDSIEFPRDFPKFYDFRQVQVCLVRGAIDFFTDGYTRMAAQD